MTFLVAFDLCRRFTLKKFNVSLFYFILLIFVNILKDFGYIHYKMIYNLILNIMIERGKK